MANRNPHFIGATDTKGKTNPISGKTVLICDDSALQRRKLRDLFYSLGFQCVGECSNGLECLNLAESVKPDLVSLDVLMPVMHGLETVKYLKENSYNGFIILVSALGAEDSLTNYPFGEYAPDAIFSKRDTRESFRNILEQMFELQPEIDVGSKQKTSKRKKAS